MVIYKLFEPKSKQGLVRVDSGRELRDRQLMSVENPHFEVTRALTIVGALLQCEAPNCWLLIVNAALSCRTSCRLRQGSRHPSRSDGSRQRGRILPRHIDRRRIGSRSANALLPALSIFWRLADSRRNRMRA